MAKTSATIDLSSMKKAYDDSSKVATNYIDFDATNGLRISQSCDYTKPYIQIVNSGINIVKDSTHKVTIDATSGMLIYAGDTANAVAQFGSTVQIGKSAQGHINITSGGLDIYRNTALIAHLGYDTTSSTKPYFTFGSRATSSTHVDDVTPGFSSIAAGYEVVATGSYSHAEGNQTTAIGINSHAEGIGTIAKGAGSHSEGASTTAEGDYSHAEGNTSYSFGQSSHAEGSQTSAIGNYSHSGGSFSTAGGDYSFAYGRYAHATVSYQIVFGKYNQEDSDALFIIGNGTSTAAKSNIFTIKNTGDLQIKDGFKIVNGTGDFLQLSANNLKFFLSDDTTNAIAQFGSTIQIGKNTAGQTRTEIDANGMRIIRKNDTTDVQIANLGYGLGNAETGTATAPYYTLGVRLAESAIGNYSVAEGGRCVASGSCSHAEGFRAEATGYCTHAEGVSSVATLDGAHAEGAYTNASGAYAHAEGYMTGATGQSAHAEGRATVAQGRDSHAGGDHTTATTQAQTVIGGYNELDTGGTAATRGDYAFIIGNGTSTTARSNALMVDWDGYIYPQATKMTDFVVEQGTDGIWTYRKWNSGIAECWGRYSVTLTKYTTVSSFAGYTSTVNFPSGLFISGQIPTHTYVATVGSGFTMPASGMGADNTKMNVYALATASANNQSCVFDIIAKGRWK